jgi:DNA-binding IclR family transcriptional regulator
VTRARTARAGPSGTQSIERVVALLRVVASRGRLGMRLAEVSLATGLPSSTCYRMLQCLVAQGLLDCSPVSRKYQLGPLIFELGLLARPRLDLAERCAPVLAEIAEVTQDTVYLSERRGLEAICSARALGDYPIKALTLDVGVRRPMGIGAGGLAILCALSAEEAEAVVEANAPLYARFSALDAERVREAVQQGRERGYAFLDGPVVPGVAAVAVAFPAEAPVAAISVAAISSRLDAVRRAEVAALLERLVQPLLRQPAAAAAGRSSGQSVGRSAGRPKSAGT